MAAGVGAAAARMARERERESFSRGKLHIVLYEWKKLKRRNIFAVIWHRSYKKSHSKWVFFWRNVSIYFLPTAFGIFGLSPNRHQYTVLVLRSHTLACKSNQGEAPPARGLSSNMAGLAVHRE